MSIHSLFLCSVLALSAAAGPALAAKSMGGSRNLENAYETTLELASLPAGPAGGLTVRECRSCKPVTLRVTSATRYVVGQANAAPVSRAAFREASAAPEAASRLLTVFYSLDTGLVTRIVLSAD
jgi:hypothetical protein